MSEELAVRIRDSVVRELRSTGCVVAVFTPGELKGLNPVDVEDAMVLEGNEYVHRGGSGRW